MKLYIFRCRVKPRIYGATRYETGSNLPTQECSGGWEFYERVDLTPRGTLDFAVDTGTVRRRVEQRGWHVWEQSPSSPRRPKPESIRLPRQPPQPSAGLKSVAREEFAEYSRKEAAAKSTSLPRHQQEPTGDPAADFSGATPAPLARMAPSTRTDERPAPPAPMVKPDKVELLRNASRLPARHHVVWFDIPVRDIDRAVRFYSAVLGTPLKQERAGPGAAVAVLPTDGGSIGGSLVQNIDTKPSESGPLLYLNTHGRLDEALTAVEKHGGKVLAERHSVAPFGFRAIVLDSEGNRIALHSA